MAFQIHSTTRLHGVVLQTDRDNFTACSDYLRGDTEKCGKENIVLWSGIPRGGAGANQFLGPCVACGFTKPVCSVRD